MCSLWNEPQYNICEIHSFKSWLSAKQKVTENDSCLGGKSIQIKLCCLAPGTAWSQPNRE